MNADIGLLLPCPLFTIPDIRRLVGSSRDCPVNGHKRYSDKSGGDFLVETQVLFDRADALQRVIDLAARVESRLLAFAFRLSFLPKKSSVRCN
jgi:hypothetical protein